jgi:crossover junction endodeoxyribonuclease RuvC
LIETAPGAPRLIEAGILKGKSALPLEKRLLNLHEGLSEIIRDGSPDSIAVESLFSNYKHPGAALQMAHARGVLLLAAAQNHLPVFAYEPARVKKSLTGRGAATKSQMQQMIQSVFGLPAPPSPADVADAVAVALCHANAISRGNLTAKRERGQLPEALASLIEQGSRKTRGNEAVIEAIEKALRKR